MLDVLDLYCLAEEEQIRIDEFHTGVGSFCLKRGNSCAIALDTSRRRTEAEKKVDLGHELGHCETGSFYNVQTKFEVRGKMERRANIWAIQKLVSADELHRAVSEGNTELWQLAEYFDLPEDFMEMAVAYYKGIE